MAENSEAVICKCSYFMDAGYHPVSLSHLHPAWNVLCPAIRDWDLQELRNILMRFVFLAFIMVCVVQFRPCCQV